jgi:hypothetical protein
VLLALAACSSQTSGLAPETSPSIDTSPGDQSATVNPSTSPSLATRAKCGDPTAHVYHPYRLEMRNPCQTVSGVIRSIRTEGDGDLHVRLELDPQYANLINSMNVQGQHGDLVLEPVCEGQVTQADAVSACSGYSNPIRVPPIGTHVVATGAYVLDQPHGWMELHPLFDIHMNP